MHLRNSKKRICKILSRSPGRAMVILGVALLSVSLLLIAHPLYRLAWAAGEDGEGICHITVSPDTLFELGNLNPGDAHDCTLTVTNDGDMPAYLWLEHERVDGDPLPGETGDLFSQLSLIISWNGIVFYNGPQSGLTEPLNISAKMGPLRPGQTVDLDFSIFLPGRETGNEFQGSTVTTKIVLIAQCGNGEVVPPEEPGTDPGDDKKPKQPHLPRTGSLSLIFTAILGLLLISSGILLKKQSAAKENWDA